MNDTIPENLGPAEKRAAAERIIARYPDVENQELNALLRYLRKSASAIDRATIGGNAGLAEQYRRLRRDHYFDRLRPAEVALAAIVAIAILGMIVATIVMVETA